MANSSEKKQLRKAMEYATIAISTNNQPTPCVGEALCSQLIEKDNDGKISFPYIIIPEVKKVEQVSDDVYYVLTNKHSHYLVFYPHKRNGNTYLGLLLKKPAKGEYLKYYGIAFDFFNSNIDGLKFYTPNAPINKIAEIGGKFYIEIGDYTIIGYPMFE